MQMLLAAMLIDPAHTALEDGEEAFNRVGVRIAAPVLTDVVTDNAVIRKVLAKMDVLARFVGHDVRLTRDAVA